MPIPKPKKGEKQRAFISRCMSNDTMQREYPDRKQRTAVCFSAWRKVHGGKPPKKELLWRGSMFPIIETKKDD